MIAPTNGKNAAAVAQDDDAGAGGEIALAHRLREDTGLGHQAAAGAAGRQRDAAHGDPGHPGDTVVHGQPVVEEGIVRVHDVAGRTVVRQDNSFWLVRTLCRHRLPGLKPVHSGTAGMAAAATVADCRS